MTQFGDMCMFLKLFYSLCAQWQKTFSQRLEAKKTFEEPQVIGRWLLCCGLIFFRWVYSLILFHSSLLWQCGAAIYEQCPDSVIFKLPALAHQDVRNWMTTTFCTDLAILQANAGNPVDLQRIQDRSIQLAFEEVRALQSKNASEMKKLMTMLDRRTSVLSPTKGFSMDTYHQCELMFYNYYNVYGL